MRSRKDQVQAYFFVVGRLVAGLAKGEPDTPERPNHRLAMGVAIGLLLSVLITGGFAIYGLFRPGGSDAWRKPGSVILVKETGARYLLIDGQLRPVLNYTSARLALGNDAPITSVSRRSLTGVPVGPPVGIPGAPDAPPAPDRLYTGAWTVCARPAAEGETGRTVLLLAGEVGTPLHAERGLLVATADDTLHLVWQERRYRLARPELARVLGYGAVRPIRVSPGWLNPIPAGRDLTAPRIEGLGRPGPTVAGRPGVIGQVYEVRNPVLDATAYHLLGADGLVPLSGTAAALILADPATAEAYPQMPVQPIPVGPEVFAGVPVVPDADLVVGYPPIPPATVNDLGADLPCVRHQPRAGAGTAVTVVALPPDRVRDVAPVAAATSGVLADEVMIPTGGGVLARNRARPDAGAGTLYLVSEFGVKFPIPDEKPLGALGYGGVPPVDLPGELLALLATGPVLTSEQALTVPMAGG